MTKLMTMKLQWKAAPFTGTHNEKHQHKSTISAKNAKMWILRNVSQNMKMTLIFLPRFSET